MLLIDGNVIPVIRRVDNKFARSLSLATKYGKKKMTDGLRKGLASYGDAIDPKHLEPFFAARDLQGALWGAILSTRFVDRRERAAEWMAVCRVRYG